MYKQLRVTSWVPGPVLWAALFLQARSQSSRWGRTCWALLSSNVPGILQSGCPAGYSSVLLSTGGCWECLQFHHITNNRAMSILVLISCVYMYDYSPSIAVWKYITGSNSVWIVTSDKTRILPSKKRLKILYFHSLPQLLYSYVYIIEKPVIQVNDGTYNIIFMTPLLIRGKQLRKNR